MEKSADKYKYSSLDWIECCYQAKFDNVIEKLEAAEFGNEFESDLFGTGVLLWKIRLAKEGPIADAAAEKDSEADKFSVGVYLHLESSAAGEVEARFDLDYADNEFRHPFLQQLYKPFGGKDMTSRLFDSSLAGWGEEKAWTKQSLKTHFCLDSTGALTLRVTIHIKNSHRIVNDLAAHSHALRVGAHLAYDKPASGGRLPLIEIRAVEQPAPNPGESEEDDDEEDEDYTASDDETDNDFEIEPDEITSDGYDQEIEDDEKLRSEDHKNVTKTAVSAAELGPVKVQAEGTNDALFNNDKPVDAPNAQQDICNTCTCKNINTGDELMCMPGDAVGEDSTEINYKSVTVWKSMLGHASSVFNTMLMAETNSIESESWIVTIKDFPYEAVCLFVDYIERGPAVIDAATEQLPMLVRMAHKYRVKDLYNLGVARMLKTIKLENVAKYYATARLLTIPEVKEACIKAVKQNWNVEAGSSEFWKSHFKPYGVDIVCEAVADYVKLG